MKKSLKVVTIILTVVMVISITSTALAYTKVDFDGTVSDNYYTNTTAKKSSSHTSFWTNFRKHYLTSNGRTVGFTTRAYLSGTTGTKASNMIDQWETISDMNYQSAEFYSNYKDSAITVRMKVDNTYYRGSAMKLTGIWGTGTPTYDFPWG